VAGPVSLSCSSCGVATVTSTGPSADCTYDVGLKISYYPPYGNPTSDSTYLDGYLSRINYISTDACGYALPSISLNEQFGGWNYNNGTYNWNHPVACYNPITGSTQCQSGYAGWVWSDLIFHSNCAGCTPPLTNPQNPLSTTGVDYASQTWRLGSTTIGVGVIVQTDTQQRYVDHGRHLGIVSPVGP